MRIAILTNFKEFNPGYSLTGIVLDQCWMLSKHGHDVTVFTAEDCKGGTGLPDHLNIKFKKVIPHPALHDYRSRKDLIPAHKDSVDKIAEVFIKELADYDFAITHDFIFTGWNMLYALAVMKASPALHATGLRWGHWIHSIPTGALDWWNFQEYGPGHRIIFPNSEMKVLVAQNYRTDLRMVRKVPHIKDLRTWFEFSDDTLKFIDDFPKVMQADVVQIYPASSDRLKTKRLRELILIFKNIKNIGFSVCLVCANQWATGKAPRDNIEKYIQIAKRNGLVYGEDFIFTSEWDKKYNTGIPKRMLRELLQCSSLFIYPTRDESFGLVGPEAALAGGVMMLLNKSLKMMFEVHGFTGLYADFGSHDNKFDPGDKEAEYYEHLARLALGRMRDNESIMSKSFHRQTYNWDAVYSRYYAPLFGECVTW